MHRIALVIALASCYRGGDGPQEPESRSTDYPGTHCDACYDAIIPIAVTTALWTGITSYVMVKVPPEKPSTKGDRKWLWAGIGLGAATLALGTTHAVLNRDELATEAAVPGIVGLVLGAPAMVIGAIGLTQWKVAPTAMSVPGGGGVAISGRF